MLKLGRRSFFQDPFQKSQKQLEKMQRRVDQEQSERSQVEYLTKKEQKDATLLSDDFLYGKQRKHFPTRQVQENLIFKAEIKKAKDNVLTDSEYQALIQKPQKILIFQADEANLRGLSFFNSGQRGLSVLAGTYLGLLLKSKVVQESRHPTLLNICTGTSILMYLVYWRFLVSIRRSYVLKFEFDTTTECFELTQPVGMLYKTKLTIIKPQNIKLVKDDKYCVYMDSASGIKLSTVNAGQWYNEGLFMYLIQK